MHVQAAWPHSPNAAKPVPPARQSFSASGHRGQYVLPPEAGQLPLLVIPECPYLQQMNIRHVNLILKQKGSLKRAALLQAVPVKAESKLSVSGVCAMCHLGGVLSLSA